MPLNTATLSFAPSVDTLHGGNAGWLVRLGLFNKGAIDTVRQAVIRPSLDDSAPASTAGSARRPAPKSS